MVKTLLKSSLREIRQSLGRYLAILAIVGLGVGFFAGLRMSQPDMMATGVEYLRTYNLFDFQLMSTLGFTDEDVEAFSQIDGIASAEGSVYTDFLMERDENEEIVITARSLTETVNQTELVSGRMPEAANECVGDAHYFTEEDLGTTIKVSPNNDEDTLDLLTYDEYTLVGLIRSPYYLNYERGTSSIGSGSVAGFVYIPEDGFTFDAYYEIYLAIDGAADAYSDEYKAQIDSLKSQVEDLTEQRADLRYTTLYDDAMTEIQDGEKEVSDGWDEYNTEKADAEKELNDAHQELLDGEQDYKDGLADYEDGKRQYEDGLKEYEDGLKTLEDAKAELEDVKAQLDDAKAELDDAKAQLEEGQASYEQLNTLYQSGVQLAQATGTGSPDALVKALQAGTSSQLNSSVDQALKAQGSSLEEFLGGWTQAEESIGQPLTQEYLDGLKAQMDQGQAEYDEGLAEYEDGYAQYEDGLKEYQDGLAQSESAKKELDDAAAELRDAERELKDARQELDDGWIEYEDGVKEADQEFADAEKDLQDGEQELADAREELEDLKRPTTYVLTREENTGYVCFDNDTSIVAAISLVFPVFFFLVAALVCMTTMTRMVDEQRTQIGVLKALGYSNGQIMGKYLFYSGSAAVVGSAVGYAAGAHWLPWIIWEIYGIIYGFAELTFVFDPALAVVSFVSALLCSMGATYLSCRVELTKAAAELIRPKSPKAGRRVFLEYITPLWRRLSFLHKVSIRNVLRYRSRLIMMVLGIGGCTALLVTGFGLRDSIKSVVDDQYAEITLFDYNVAFQDPQTEESVADYLAECGWERDDALLVHNGSVDVVHNGNSKSVNLVVSASNDLEGFISLHSGEREISYPGSGEIVVNVGLAENMGISVGNTLELRDDDAGSMTVTVSDICDNYVFNYVYVSPDTYQEQLNTEPEYKNLYLLAHEGADPYQEGALLAEDDGVSNVTINEATRTQVDNMLTRMDYIVLVVVVCAGALAFIVLYNLTNINITERIREIATIEVLGFYQNEVASYVFREIFMLSALGSIVGLAMGKGLHAFVMAQVQIDSMFFPCWIAPLSYLYALALTLLFTLVIFLALKPRLRKVDMAESLKSIE